jgi:hypothetical protein
LKSVYFLSKKEAKSEKEFSDFKVIIFPVVVTYALNIMPTSVCRLCTLTF